MSDLSKSEEIITAPIDDYLLSIADSLQRVQLQLNQNKVLSVDGQSHTTYQLPKLEFELRMSIEMDSITQNGQSRSVMKAVPVNPSQTNSSRSSKQSQSIESASIIKGVFVAVPSDLGKPPPKIRTFIERYSTNEYKIMVNVQSAVGEYLKDIEVHFNIDKEMSRKSSEADNLNIEALQNDTFLKDAIQTTDENGIAFTQLQVSKEEMEMSSIAVLIDVLGKTETVIIQVDKSAT